jgi:hypothetical protein
VGVPELELTAGQVGRVVSAWFYPNEAYEVEFGEDRRAASATACRVLLLHGQRRRQRPN